MIDLHLINMALAGLGIGAGAVVLIAAAIIVSRRSARTGRRCAGRSRRPVRRTSGRQAATSPVGARAVGQRAALSWPVEGSLCDAVLSQVREM